MYYGAKTLENSNELFSSIFGVIFSKLCLFWAAENISWLKKAVQTFQAVIMDGGLVPLIHVSAPFSRRKVDI